MALNIKSFSQLVSEQVIAIQARATKLVDFSIGSMLLSLAQSNAGVTMWIQQLIVKLLVTTRAATCSGEDLDSWMADFSFPRLSAVQSTGWVTFSRFTATSSACIPVGNKVTTTDGSESYSVVKDSTLKAWDAGQSGYVIAAGVSSLRVPVKADTAGSAGNAQPGKVNVMKDTVLYVDKVTNVDAFEKGKDAEPDDEYRARFVEWIASLSKATKAAVGFALRNLQRGVSYTLTENMDYQGSVRPGYFYAVVDDGSGVPSEDFLNRARMAIDAVRGFTVMFGVFRPQIINADISLSVTTESAADHAGVASLVEQAIGNYLTGLSLGKLLAYTQLVRVAYGASPLVTNVTFLRLNGGNADLAASDRQLIRPGTIVVN